jgi:anaerobic ribonucleoside-triphosphate reductase activating protein
MSRHWGSNEDAGLRIARIVDRTEVLGPGRRAVVVVQGCELRCSGCIASATHPLDGGSWVAVEELASRLGSVAGIDGVTFSGGEPFLQAAALARLVDLLRRRRPGFSAMSFSGYRIEWLRSNGSPAQRELLRRLDLLVDGPYVRRRHAALRWRGSLNQRVHALSPRHRVELEGVPDRPAGVEISVTEDLRLQWVGVPPMPDFEARLAAAADIEETTGVAGERRRAR